jgi:hypothetical protein
MPEDSRSARYGKRVRRRVDVDHAATTGALAIFSTEVSQLLTGLEALGRRGRSLVGDLASTRIACY